MEISEALHKESCADIERCNSQTTITLLQKRVREFIARGEEIKVSEYHPGDDTGFFLSYVGGPKFDTWMAEINILNNRYLKEHPLHGDIEKTYSHYKQTGSSCDDMLALLRALAQDDEFFADIEQNSVAVQLPLRAASNEVFIVHGHDDTAKLEVARTLEKADFHAIILHEQPSGGQTIIEKIEANTDVAFAVVLYTPCDLGRAKEQKVEDEQGRARQNVVFEHGYLIGKLGRSHVCALVKGSVETPGDISGVVYVPMDEGGAWKFELAKEMKAAGLNVDANKFL